MSIAQKHNFTRGLPGSLPNSVAGVLWKNIRSHQVAYLFVLPALIWYIIFCYIPMAGLLLGFKEFRYNLSIWHSPWVGAKFWNQFIRDPLLLPLLKNTLKISALKILFGFPAPIIMALMLNEVSRLKLKKVLQTVSYLPYFVSWVVVVALLTKFISPNGGLVNEIRASLFNADPVYYMGKAEYFYPLLLLTFIWKNVGWNSIIYLATISGIDQQLYEAACIDGAGRWKSMLHITLPSLLPTAAILFLMSIGSIMYAGYEQVILLKTPGNSSLAQILDTQIITQGIQRGRIGYSTIAGMFQGVIGLFTVVIANFTSKKVSGISLW